MKWAKTAAAWTRQAPIQSDRTAHSKGTFMTGVDHSIAFFLQGHLAGAL
jgi:hypothetical protein